LKSKTVKFSTEEVRKKGISFLLLMLAVQSVSEDAFPGGGEKEKAFYSISAAQKLRGRGGVGVKNKDRKKKDLDT